MKPLKNMDELFVTAHPAIQDLLVTELEEMGIPHVRAGQGGVFVPRQMPLVYKINYCSRLATRVLWPLATFPCRDRDELYRRTVNIPWPEIFSLEKSFAIDANVSSPTLRHSLFAAQVLKDAVCDRFREECGSRPFVNVENPDIQLNLYIQGGMGTVSLDTSGPPLYKRGWRRHSGQAPIQESLAAAVLLLSGFPSDEILCDPFCGSGTILIEAAMMKSRTPAGFFRESYGFFHHPAFSEKAWEKVKEEANEARVLLEPGKIFGADKDPKACEMCTENLLASGFDDVIEVSCKDIRSYFPTVPPSLIISNPPYGKRMASSVELYRALAHFLKTRCAKKIQAQILGPDKKLVEEAGLPVRAERDFVSGGLDLKLFEL
ncbi:MAG: class I SAM-dependent RNA methyltransferase [Chlamydiales bacterium]